MLCARHRARFLSPLSPSGSTLSTHPVRIASCGMPKITALSSLSAIHCPFLCLMALVPSAPSRPIPVSTTPSAACAACFRSGNHHPVRRGHIFVGFGSARANFREQSRPVPLDDEMVPSRRNQDRTRAERGPRLRLPETTRDESLFSRSAKLLVNPGGMC